MIASLGLLGLMASFASGLEMDLNSQAGVSWTITNCDRSISIPGSVPGVVHTDLMSAGVIKENPYYRFNELEQSWVSKETCWRYEAVIDLSQFSSDEQVFLHLTGVDTVATLYLNEQEIGHTSNAFRTYNLPLPWTSISSSNSNTLSVQIASPISYPKQQAAAYPYAVPATENYNVWAEPSSRNFMRKAGSDFGWDWGPAFAPSGLTGEVSLFQSGGQIGMLESLVMLQAVTVAEGGLRGSAVVTPRLRVAGVSDAAFTSVAVTIKVNNETVLTETATLMGKENSHAKYAVLQLSEITLSDVELWFPRGYGQPTLYTVDVAYCPVSSSGSNCQTLSKRIGFRTVELVQEPLEAAAVAEEVSATQQSATAFSSRSQGAPPPPPPASAHPSLTLVNPPPASFFLKINGIPIFAKGANFIPIDVFSSRVTDSDRKYVLQAAAAAHMNMVSHYVVNFNCSDECNRFILYLFFSISGSRVGRRDVPNRRLLRPG
jgi:beta-mannosidase